jgi:hypothetical protein
MNIEDIDIIDIDKQIKEIFKEQQCNINKFRDKLNDLIITYNSNGLSYRSKQNIEKSINELRQNIHDIENKISYNFYISETVELLKEYTEILSTPQQMSFIGKVTRDNKRKRQIIQSFIDKCKKYIDIDVLNKNVSKLICNNCNNKKNFENDENIYRCLECGSEQEDHTHISSYRDIDRVNISTKYTYDRIIHFRDSMNQYQGKQNSTIDPDVYKDLENEFERHHLLIGDKNTPREVKFKKIDREHVFMFLKELGYTKHYENVILIHYKLTGVKPDDISHLEDDLMNDFMKLTELYDQKYKKNIDRKNFMNTQHILYQLLNNRKHPCKKEDFNMLKTTDRKFFHDEVCADLFQQLGWNYSPFV